MKRSELKRRPRAPRERISEVTMSKVRFRQGGRCACGCRRRISPAPIGYHHILPKKRWPELVDDPRNIAGVFEDCHANHETGATRLPREKVRECLADLELDPRQERYLESTYAA